MVRRTTAREVYLALQVEMGGHYPRVHLQYLSLLRYFLS